MQLDFIGFDQVLYDNGNVAIGWSVSAQGNQAIAIGAGSDTSRAATAVPSTTLNGTTYYFAGGATTLAGDQVSIGRVGYERQIKNVAAGEISTTSTDAVNGSQLYALTQAVEREISFNGDVTLITGEGVTITPTTGNAVSLTTTGLDNGSNKITNVADGAVSSTSTDVINGSQLYDTANSIATALGGGSIVNTDGTVSAPTYTINKLDGTTSAVNNVGDALTTLNDQVVTPITFAGDSGTNVDRKLGSKLNIVGGQTDASKLSSAPNIGVVANGSQLYSVAAGVAKLDNKIDQTGAMSAALAG